VSLLTTVVAPHQVGRFDSHQAQPIFLPALVRTYNAGLSFALLFFLLGSQSLLKILHYCPISSCIQQPCPPALPGSSTNFDQIWCARSLRSSHRTVLEWQVTKLHARAAVLTGLNLFSCSYLDLLHHLYINLTLPKFWLVHYSSFIFGPNSSKFGR
jgi:hypothetical protein